MLGKHSPGYRQKPYFPVDAFSESNLQRKIEQTFAAADREAARAILAELDRMPVEQPTQVDGLRARCKFDAVWLSKGRLDRLREGVAYGMQDFPNLIGIAEDDRVVVETDPDYFHTWVVS